MASIKWCHFVIFSPGFCRASRHWVNSVSSVALKPSRTCPIISSVRSRSWSYTEKVMAVHRMVSGCGEMQNMNLSPKTGSIHFFFIFVWWRSFSSPFKESSTRTYGSTVPVIRFGRNPLACSTVALMRFSHGWNRIVVCIHPRSASLLFGPRSFHIRFSLSRW